MATAKSTLWEKVVAFLRFYGYFYNEGPFHRVEYDDDKIRLTSGLVPSNEGYGFNSDWIAIYIKSPPSPLQPDKPFGMPTKAPPRTETIVYFQSKSTSQKYIRPGKWEAYISRLHDELIQSSKSFESLNGKPIEDDILFG